MRLKRCKTTHLKDLFHSNYHRQDVAKDLVFCLDRQLKNLSQNPKMDNLSWHCAAVHGTLRFLVPIVLDLLKQRMYFVYVKGPSTTSYVASRRSILNLFKSRNVSSNQEDWYFEMLQKNWKTFQRENKSRPIWLTELSVVQCLQN